MDSLDGAMTGGIGLGVLLSTTFAVVGLVAGAYWVWLNAPPVVDGNLWVYVRAGVTIVGAIVAAKVGAIFGWIVGGILGGLSGLLLG